MKLKSPFSELRDSALHRPREWNYSTVFHWSPPFESSILLDKVNNASLFWILIFIFPVLICYRKRRLWQRLISPTSTIALDCGCHKRAQIWSKYHFQRNFFAPLPPVTPTDQPTDRANIVQTYMQKTCDVAEKAILAKKKNCGKSA